MRRTLSILIALTLVAGAATFTGCSQPRTPGWVVPSCQDHVYVVDENCFPTDSNGNPYNPPATRCCPPCP